MSGLAEVTFRVRRSSENGRVVAGHRENSQGMFGFWTATVVPLIGVMLVVSGTFRS